jgi:hypothetical protein
MRFACISLVTFAAAATASAQAPAGQLGKAPDTLAKVYACADVTRDAERLACFDNAVTALKTAQETGAFAAVDSAQVKELQREAFGFRLPSLPKLAFPTLRQETEATAPVEMNLTIARLGRADGKTTAIMSNGQVWIIVDSETNRNLRPGADVTIREAALESFLLSFAKGGAALRVRRTQ